MTTSSILTLLAYTVVAVVVSLAGGAFPRRFNLSHARMQTAISLVAGLMLGMALLHFLPHAADSLHCPERASRWALGGFLVMFFLQRIFHYHQHEVSPAAAADHPPVACGHAHNHSPASVNPLSWSAALAGMSLHSVLDGLALGAAVLVETLHPTGLVGLGTAIAVILHKPFDAMAVLTLMQASGCRSGLQRVVNLALALMVPLGVLLAVVGLGGSVEANHHALGAALAFCGGGFLCIACSDLLPEVHFHTHHRLRLSLALLAGLAVAVLVGLAHGHDHDHGAEHQHGMKESKQWFSTKHEYERNLG